MHFLISLGLVTKVHNVIMERDARYDKLNLRKASLEMQSKWFNKDRREFVAYGEYGEGLPSDVPFGWVIEPQSQP